MLTTILAVALSIWPFTSSGPNHSHSRAAHARHLRHLQESRHKRLSHQHHVAHPSLIHAR
jgi:hypothetical protein